MNNKEIMEKLSELLNDARRVYEVNGRTDFDAGAYKGIQRAIEAVKEA